MYLNQKGDFDPETVILKTSIDATRMTNRDSACVYVLQTISKKTEISVVGAVKGGDSGADMDLSAGPYFEQLKDLDMNPWIETSFGVVKVQLRGGGESTTSWD